MRRRARWLATLLVLLLGLAFSLYLLWQTTIEVLGLFTVAGWAAVLALLPTLVLLVYVLLVYEDSPRRFMAVRRARRYADSNAWFDSRRRRARS